MLNDYLIVFIYTRKDNITSINLDSIRYNNSNIPIVEVHTSDFQNIYYDFLGKKPIVNWSIRELWYSCDNIFLYWYLSNDHIRAKNYILIEWDTFVHNTSLIDFFGNQIIENEGITAAKIITKTKEPNDYWFTQQKDNKLLNHFYGIEHTKKYTPMSCTTISDKCVQDIIAHIQNNPECNQLYIETKFATIASYLGYPLQQYNNNVSNYISYHENICERTLAKLTNNGNNKNFQGVFHPIKKYSIYRKYFMNQENNYQLKDNINIISAIYGSGIDLKEDIIDLLSKKNNISINNEIGGDPLPHKKKSLFLTYEKNGQIYRKIIPESSTLDLNNL